MVSIKEIIEEALGLPKGSLKIKSQEITIERKLNDGNDGIPPKPKDLGILPNFI